MTRYPHVPEARESATFGNLWGLVIVRPACLRGFAHRKQIDDLTLHDGQRRPGGSGRNKLGYSTIVSGPPGRHPQVTSNIHTRISRLASPERVRRAFRDAVPPRRVPLPMLPCCTPFPRGDSSSLFTLSPSPHTIYTLASLPPTVL